MRKLRATMPICKPALLNDAAVQLYQSEARPQATLEKKGKGKFALNKSIKKL